MLRLLDTHTHVYLEEFDNDRSESIKKSIDSGVIAMILPNVDATTTSRLKDLTSQLPNFCFPMMGLHPTSVKENYEKELQIIENEIFSRNYCAIGEIGTDLYWDKTFIKEQQLVFKKQMQIAKSKNIPAIIHIRNSFEETFSVINDLNYNEYKGIFHCFSGDVNQAKKAIEMGFLIGVGGVVTYKNSILQQVVKEIDIGHIVLETDAPYLAPVPYRGKRNESKFLTIIAQKIAEIKEISVDEVAETTTNNAINLFKLNL